MEEERNVDETMVSRRELYGEKFIEVYGSPEQSEIVQEAVTGEISGDEDMISLAMMKRKASSLSRKEL
ncbi:unnamed protein product, partial [Iphiclides podalirius]